MNRATLLILLGSLCLGGCASYYKVTDPTTNRTYYTSELKKDEGSVTLKDARSGDTVTVQNSVVQKISKEEFQTAKYTSPAPAK